MAWRRRGGMLAQYRLGAMLANGEGGSEDCAEARKTCELAAAQGGAVAQFRLGVMHWHAEGGPED